MPARSALPRRSARRPAGARRACWAALVVALARPAAGAPGAPSATPRPAPAGSSSTPPGARAPGAAGGAAGAAPGAAEAAPGAAPGAAGAAPGAAGATQTSSAPGAATAPAGTVPPLPAPAGTVPPLPAPAGTVPPLPPPAGTVPPLPPPAGTVPPLPPPAGTGPPGPAGAGAGGARRAPAGPPRGPGGGASGEAGGVPAGPAPALLWPTLTPAGDEPAGEPLRIPSEKDGPLAERARDLDALLVDTAQDLGLTVDLGRRPYDKPRATRDLDLVEVAGAARAWVISPRLEREGGEYVVRIVAVPPGGRALRVRVERVKGPALAVRAAVMLRDLVGASPTGVAAGAEAGRAPEAAATAGDVATRARSGGRAVLAVSGAAFGGFTGFALQRASRNDDPRLLYPLVALGTGVGLGAALIAADEWDVRPGEAWYLAAGTWWPVASALFLTAGYGLEPETDRYAVALLSGLGGTGLASFVLSQRRVGEGDALLVHSGGLVGTVVGGGAQWLVEGSTKVHPYRGLGYGAAAGVLAAGALATQVRISPARLLLVDLGAGLGALAGAAAGSPLLFDAPSKGEERAWVSLTLGGTLAGGVAALWLTRSMVERAAWAPPAWLPTPSTITALDGPARGARAPGLGLAWRGTW